MNSQSLSAKLFFALAILSALTGFALIRPGLPLSFYFNPLIMLLVPRLLPFGLALISASFAFVYFVIENQWRRKPNLTLSIAQLVFLLLSVYGQLTVLRFWSFVLGNNVLPGPDLPLPLHQAVLAPLGLALAVLAFLANIVISRFRPRQDASAD